MYLFDVVFSEDAGLYGNIMYDRRIVRGNTYAQHTLPAVRTLRPTLLPYLELSALLEL